MKRRIPNLYGMIIILASLLLIAVGLLQGQFSDVLHKAVQICLECIGVG
ncbi:MAG: hypothetical protein K6E62_05295 [Lachnospiraceae bacterium]|nr:hypothetical protein [Lachnospiraceae bacterium]